MIVQFLSQILPFNSVMVVHLANDITYLFLNHLLFTLLLFKWFKRMCGGLLLHCLQMDIDIIFRLLICIVGPLVCFCLKIRVKLLKSFMNLRAMLSFNFTIKIKVLQSDYGKEFLVLKPLLKSCGINFRNTCPYTHQKNGVVERKHRHLLNIALYLFAHAFMPLSF